MNFWVLGWPSFPWFCFLDLHKILIEALPLTVVNVYGRLLRACERYRDSLVVVEGKRDVSALEHLGFTRVYAIHQPSVPIRERVLSLISLTRRREKILILTDFDRRGKQLHDLLKRLFQEQGIMADSCLRGLFRQLGFSHFEGVANLFEELN